MMIPQAIHSPHDTLQGANSPEGNSLLDFWKWAYGDLCDDDVKGVFAEWLVHRLLGIESRRRVSWANSDVITPEGVRIEVKASSYWQSWKFLDEKGLPYDKPLHTPVQNESSLRFGGLRARDATNASAAKSQPMLKSHLYVFVLNKEKDLSKWNAMDLSQWDFYIARAEDLAQIAGKSVTVAKLRPAYGPLSANQFVQRGKLLIEHVASEMKPV
jgi:hypothetical protein